MLIPQGLVQQANAAAFWHRHISAFFAVVEPEALPLELLPFEVPTRRDDQCRSSDSSRPKRQRMYSIPLRLESEEMEDMESDEEGFCGSERRYRFKSLRGCLILVVDNARPPVFCGCS